MTKRTFQRPPGRPLLAGAWAGGLALAAASAASAGAAVPATDLDQLLTELAIGPYARAQAAHGDAAALRGRAPQVRSSDLLEAVRSTVLLLEGIPHQRSEPRVRLIRGTRASIARALLSAGRSTGISPAYLWRTAHRESGLDPEASAAGSTARGLFQFVDATWLAVVARHGARHGVSAAPRAQLLALRADPWVSARMAAELARENRLALERALGRRVSDADLYVAHFLGSADAVRLIRAAEHRPHLSAAALLPAAARANPAVFFERGRALSCRQLVESLRHG